MDDSEQTKAMTLAAIVFAESSEALIHTADLRSVRSGGQGFFGFFQTPTQSGAFQELQTLAKERGWLKR